MGKRQEILIDGSNPTRGWAVIFAGGSASGKSTLIREMTFKGEVLSTDTYGEQQIDIHNNAAEYAKKSPESLRIAEEIVRDGMKSKFPERNIINKVQNLVLDFESTTVSPSKVSALLSIGAHKHKVEYFKERIKYNAEHGMSNLVLDMTGKEREVKLYADYLHNYGYKVALLWVITNRSQALIWNAMRRRSMKISGVHSGHKGPNSYLLDALQDNRSDMFDDVWLIFNSTESIQRCMTEKEYEESVVKLLKSDDQYIVSTELAEKVKRVLGPLDDSDYIPQRWIKDFFVRYRIIRKISQEQNIKCPEVNELLVSLLNKDKKQNEQNISAFYKKLQMKEPKTPVAPCECYDVNYPVREQFDSEDKFQKALALYPEQKASWEKSKVEWAEYERNFEVGTINSNEPMDHVTYKYDFTNHNIKDYSKHVKEIDDAIRTVEAIDINPLREYFQQIKSSGATLCFYGAGGAVSPSLFAAQVANDEGIIAITMTPLEVITLSEEVVKKMQFLAISGSGKPADMVSATNYLINIAPENVACLTTASINHKDRFGHFDNKVGKMIQERNPGRAFFVDINIHSDGFVATRKHVALSLLVYRAFHPEETGFVEKLILPEQKPFVLRLPNGMMTKDITDLHVLYGAKGKCAANDMEGRMLECGVLPAMATDFKNFTHGRHVFVNTRQYSTLLMLTTPQDVTFVKKMLKLIPEDRSVIFIHTNRNDILGVLQLMICTFYLGNELGYERGINMHSPGAPKWGGKLWSLKLEGYDNL